MMFRRFLSVSAAALLVLMFSTPAEALWRNGVWVNPEPYRFFSTETLNFRPMAPNQRRLKVQHWRIHSLPTNEKGMNIGATRLPNGRAWAYRRIEVRHCRISDAHRSGPGWHVDFIRIFGGGDHQQNVPTRVILDDIHIHDGDALPIIIQDGEFDLIALRHINIERTTTGVQIVAINTGHIREVRIANSPGIRVAICGRPGSIERVIIRNSPGAQVRDTITHAGRSGVQIIYE